MELSEFIKVSVLEVMKGVSMAQGELSGDYREGFVNPTWSQLVGAHNKAGFGDTETEFIELTVAITEINSKEGKKRIGVAPAIFNAGVDSRNSVENSIYSQVKIKVPVTLPVMDVNRPEE